MISIYKIVDNTNGNIYVGSTQQLLKYRKKQHESKYNPCRSREIIKNNDYYFELIEECEEDKRNEREQYWIDKYDCVNKKETYNARKWGKKEENKLKMKEWNKNNKKYKDSWGGDKRSNNNLLMIDVNLFL